MLSLPLPPLPLPLTLTLPGIVSTATISLVNIRASATVIRVVRVLLYKQSHPHFSICSVVFCVNSYVFFVAFVVSRYYFSFSFSMHYDIIPYVYGCICYRIEYLSSLLHQYMIVPPLPPLIFFFYPVKYNYCCFFYCFCCCCFCC